MRGVIGSSEVLVRLFHLVDRVGRCESTVLITGESGTGKELVARAVHEVSPRASGPFVVVNCGAIPEALLESELFGHVRGAFTGAHQSRPGRVAVAKGGTLFLDEIGELPLALQVKLLRLLQQREYSPVGDSRTVSADVRVVAATNKDLEAEVASGAFREDLYYRLNVIHLRAPALRDRSGDVPALVEHFLAKACQKLGRPSLTVSQDTMDILQSWSWPGNVRELENTIERVAILCPAEAIEPADLPPRMRGVPVEQRTGARLPEGGLDLRAAVESFENELIRQALERTAWNRNRAATLLGLNRTTLVEMIKRKRMAQRVA
ncbi:MAG: sigma-54-dependent Fis family transcriptional regulator [Deltaproteobacteria bacterium]|nr:sigma-54-dependent Fis family transcriptional regulator [Deltaproteobacteria bacterium]